MKKIIILLIIVSSCKKNLIEERKSILENNGKTYWRVIRSDIPKVTNRGECFFKNGTFIGYRIDKVSGKRVLPEIHSDIEFVDALWCFPNDTIMIMGRDVPYKIIYFTKDSFKVKPLLWDDWILTYYKEKDQITPIDTTIPPPIY